MMRALPLIVGFLAFSAPSRAAVSAGTPEAENLIAQASAACADTKAAPGTVEACQSWRIIDSERRNRRGAGRADASELDEALTRFSGSIVEGLIPSAQASAICRRRAVEPAETGQRAKYRKQMESGCSMMREAADLAQEYSTETPLSREYYDNLAATWVSESAVLKLDRLLSQAR